MTIALITWKLCVGLHFSHKTTRQYNFGKDASGDQGLILVEMLKKQQQQKTMKMYRILFAFSCLYCGGDWIN